MSFSEWREVTLGEVTKIKGRIGWKGYKTTDLRDHGPVVLGGNNIKNSLYLDLNDVKHLSKEKYDESPEIMLRKDDILVVTRGNGIGDVSFFSGCLKEATINPSMVILSQCTENPKFLFYYLISEIGRRSILSVSSGSSIPAIYQKSLATVKCFIPPTNEQKSIAATLSCLDDKIELNNIINKILEEMAQAIFKNWFVDFEPFQDGEFEDSELGRIPKGWRAGTIGELILDAIGGDWGKDYSQGNYTEEVICIRGADIPEIALGKKGKPPIRYILKKNLDKKRLSAGQIIIEISGGSPTQSTGRTALINDKLVDLSDKPLICTNFCRALLMKKNYYSTFVYSTLQYLYNKDMLFLYENGTTGIKNLDINNLFSRHLIVIPDDNAMIKYMEYLDTIIKSMYENGNQTEKLSVIRDALLPKLMSGEVRVPIEEVQ